MQPFFTRRRFVILFGLFVVAFLVWLAVIASGNTDDASRSGADAAGYWVGSMLAAPAVLAILTISPVWLAMYIAYRRSR